MPDSAAGTTRRPRATRLGRDHVRVVEDRVIHRTSCVRGTCNDHRIGRNAAQSRLCIRQPGRRRRLDFAARRRAQGNGKGARWQGRHQVRGKCAGGRRRRARDPRARAERLSTDFHDVFRLHESDNQGCQAVSEDVFRARDRIQDGQERRHLQRALLRGPLPRRHRRGTDDQVEHRRLCRGISDSRSRDGHQRIHPRHAQRQPECGDQGRLGQHLVRPGPRARSRRHADLTGPMC